ncbi:MAG: type III pantothenate kinase, partial [Bacteroidia bacterium]
GSDRLAASVGAFGLYPGQDTLVVDAGTCVKYNFTNRNNEYLGGAISPGLQMRFKAMHQLTGRLPLVIPDDQFNKLVGTTTEESLLSGVINGLIHETDGFINDYKKQYPQLKVVFTGGDTSFFVKRLKNSIFADHDLVLKGLNDILIYNS